MKEILTHILSDNIKNVIIDCDTGADGDDQFALAYALASADRINVLGVCSEPFNDDSAEMVRLGQIENEKIISLSKLNIPSVKGSDDFITRCGKPLNSDAAEFIANVVLASRDIVYVIMSGCSTNVASALMLHPEIKEKIVIVWLAMSDIYGTDTGCEYNFMNDKLAGMYIFNCGAPLVLVPTKHIYPFAKTKDEVDELFGKDNPMCRYLTERFREITWAKGLWDLGAEGALILPGAYSFELVDAPLLDENGNVVSRDQERKIIYASSLDTNAVLSDAVTRIKA